MTYFVEIVTYLKQHGCPIVPPFRLYRRGFKRWPKALKMALKLQRLHQETLPGIMTRIVWYTMTRAELAASRKARSC